jgi:hypothetical protein
MDRMAQCYNGMVCLIFCVVLCHCSAIHADGPKNVHVGIYLNDIPTASLKENYFIADFYVWFRWTDSDIQPHESFSVTNGVIQSKEIVFDQSKGDERYVVCRMLARITFFWDTRYFPFDDHILSIDIEDGQDEDDKIVYTADTANTAISPQVRVPGWELGSPTCETLRHTYNTNYGDLSLPTGHESTYSRFQFSIKIFRSGLGYFLKLFVGMYVAVMISLLALFIEPTDLDPRFGLGVGALFAAVASQYIISGSLPDTNVLTTADILHIIAFVFIFVSLVESTISLRLTQSGRRAFARRLDSASVFIIVIVFTGLNYWVLHR